MPMVEKFCFSQIITLFQATSVISREGSTFKNCLFYGNTMCNFPSVIVRLIFRSRESVHRLLLTKCNETMQVRMHESKGTVMGASNDHDEDHHSYTQQILMEIGRLKLEILIIALQPLMFLIL